MEDEEDAEAIFDVLATVSGYVGPEPGHRHTRYTIEVVVPGQGRAWLIHRKYYEFKRLYNALYAISFPGPRLPPRQLWGPRTRSMLERRAESIDIWLQGTLAVWKSFYSPGEDDASLTVTTLLTVFLCRDSEFYVSSALASSGTNSSSNNSSSRPASRAEHLSQAATARSTPPVEADHEGAGVLSEDVAVNATVAHDAPLTRRVSDDLLEGATLGGGTGGGTVASASSLGVDEGQTRFKRVMRRLSNNLRSMFSISVPKGDAYFDQYARDDSSHHHHRAPIVSANNNHGDSLRVAQTASEPQSGVTTGRLSGSSPSRRFTATPSISWIMRGKTMFRQNSSNNREQAKKNRSGRMMMRGMSGSSRHQRKFAKDLEEEDEDLIERRKLEEKIASEVKSSTLLRGGIVVKDDSHHGGTRRHSKKKGALEVPIADEEGSIHRVFAVVEPPENDDGLMSRAVTMKKSIPLPPPPPLTLEKRESFPEALVEADSERTDLKPSLDREERQPSGQGEEQLPIDHQQLHSNEAAAASTVRRVICMTDDDGSELEWIFDSETEQDTDGGRGVPGGQGDLHYEDSRPRRRRRQHRRGGGGAHRGDSDADEIDVESAQRKIKKKGNGNAGGSKRSRSLRLDASYPATDPLFLGRVLEYVPKPVHIEDEHQKTPARRELERLFERCVVEVVPGGGIDQLRHGYGMVSVPPSPRSREIYKRPWKAYTDKLLTLVEHRLQATYVNHHQSALNHGGFDGDWVDSGSEEGGSEDGDDAASESNFVQRTLWLQDSFLHQQQQPTLHKQQQRRLEVTDDDDDDLDDHLNGGTTEEEGYNSEGWASEAANESYEGGNDREVFGSWEEGTVWIGPKRAPPEGIVVMQDDPVSDVVDDAPVASGDDDRIPSTGEEESSDEGISASASDEEEEVEDEEDDEEDEDDEEFSGEDEEDSEEGSSESSSSYTGEREDEGISISHSHISNEGDEDDGDESTEGIDIDNEDVDELQFDVQVNSRMESV